MKHLLCLSWNQGALPSWFDNWNVNRAVSLYLSMIHRMSERIASIEPEKTFFVQNISKYNNVYRSQYPKMLWARSKIYGFWKATFVPSNVWHTLGLYSVYWTVKGWTLNWTNGLLLKNKIVHLGMAALSDILAISFCTMNRTSRLKSPTNATKIGFFVGIGIFSRWVHLNQAGIAFPVKNICTKWNRGWKEFLFELLRVLNGGVTERHDHFVLSVAERQGPHAARVQWMWSTVSVHLFSGPPVLTKRSSWELVALTYGTVE